MNKLIALVVVAVSLALLAGCPEKDPKAGSTTSASSAEPAASAAASATGGGW